MTDAPAPAPRRSASRWLGRGAIALLVGLALGGGAGVFTVNKLEPGRPNGVDSLQVMLDSIARGRVAANRDAKGTTSVTATAAPTPAALPDSVPVPALANLEEGAARTAIRDAGLRVGEVSFQRSDRSAGTVLATTPAAGAFVARGTPVALTLSDGHPPTDTLPAPLPLFRP